MRAPPGSVPYWRLSASYLAYFASLGALVPYFGLYLAGAGFDPTRIGVLSATLVIGRVLAPGFWGWVADHSGSRVGMVRWTSAAAVLAFAAALAVEGMTPLALTLLVFGFFWSAGLPQVEATTLSHLGSDTRHYTRIRLWGSIGFIVAVTAVGALVDRLGLGVFGPATLALLLSVWLAALVLPEAGHPRHTAEQARTPLARVLRQPAVLLLLGVCFLMQLAHGPYYAFFSLYLERYGYSKALIGPLWSLGVLAEILVFLMMPRMLAYCSLHALLVASTVAAVLRWSALALAPEQLGVVLAAQLLHAGTFGLNHAAAIQLIHRYFVGRLQGRGQGLYSSLSFGLGGAVGAAAGGLLWDDWSPNAAFGGAAVASVLATLAAAWAALRAREGVHA